MRTQDLHGGAVKVLLITLLLVANIVALVAREHLRASHAQTPNTAPEISLAERAPSDTHPH